MVKAWFVALITASAAFNAAATPALVFTPARLAPAVGDVFDVGLRGVSFDAISAGSLINNISGGQNLVFGYSSAVFEVLRVEIDARWNFGPGRHVGTIDAAAGSIAGFAFASFPAATDDDFNIATFTLRALTPGTGALTLQSGDFFGKVGGAAGQRIVPTFGSVQMAVSAVPEPASWALLGVGLALGAFRGRRRQRV